jgi:hypothetical protein
MDDHLDILNMRPIMTRFSKDILDVFVAHGITAISLKQSDSVLAITFDHPQTETGCITHLSLSDDDDRKTVRVKLAELEDYLLDLCGVST